MRKRARSAALLLLAALGGCIPVDRGPTPAELAGGAQPQPAVSGTGPDGKALLLQPYRGRAVLLDFWRTG
jgi:hypothetical protein